jgi:uncharacterized protein YndB with AHSA1/START domain
MTDPIKVEKNVNVPASQVYFAFTHAASLVEWMCDYATVAPHPGGRMYLWWNGDFYSAGEYISLEENKSVIFWWHGRSDPCPTQVTVTLAENGGSTLVKLTQAVPEGEYWDRNAHRFSQEWDFMLANLAQVLETGLDKRTFDRPMLGINISDFNAGIARAIGVPVNEGIRLDSLNEGMGAFKAGLRQNDVLVELDGHPVTNDFGSLVLALKGKKGGDKVAITYYRGPEKVSAEMELSKRPIPQILWEPSELAALARSKYDLGLAELEKAFDGVSEAEASFEPAPGEWSAKETLAHLIQNERHFLENLDDVIGGYPRVSDDWTGNSSLHVKATVAGYKTLRSMLDELKCLSDEMVGYVAALPASFVERKASYFQVANMLLEGSIPHIGDHIPQVRRAVEAARPK